MEENAIMEEKGRARPEGASEPQGKTSLAKSAGSEAGSRSGDSSGLKPAASSTDVTWDDVLDLCSGLYENGEPACAASLATFRLDGDGEAESLKSVILKNAIIQARATGGCAVVTADFSAMEAREYQSAMDLCREALEADDESLLLVLTLVPLSLDGATYVTMPGLVAADGYAYAGGTHMIMAFDHTASECAVSNEIDYGEVMREIGFRIHQMDEEADKELEEAARELRELEEEHSYSAMLTKRLTQAPLERALEEGGDGIDGEGDEDRDEDEDGMEYRYETLRVRRGTEADEET